MSSWNVTMPAYYLVCQKILFLFEETRRKLIYRSLVCDQGAYKNVTGPRLYKGLSKIDHKIWMTCKIESVNK